MPAHKLRRIIYCLLFLIFWGVSLRLLFQWTPKSPDLSKLDALIHSEQFAKPFRSVLVPADLHSFQVPSYPYVGISPSQKKYWFVLIKEQQEKSQEPIFYAHKRIAELLTFHNTLTDADWQKQLDMYSQYIDKELEKIDLAKNDYVRTGLYAEVHTYLRKHETDLLDILLDQKPKDEATLQLVEAVKAHFVELFNKIPKQIVAGDTILYYPLDIDAQRQFGEYTLEVKSLDPFFTQDHYQVVFNDRPVVFTTETTGKDSLFASEPIIIDSIDDRVELRTKTVPSSSRFAKPHIEAQETAASAQAMRGYAALRESEQFFVTLTHFSDREEKTFQTLIGDGWMMKSSTSHRPFEITYTFIYWPKTALRFLLLFGLPFVFLTVSVFIAFPVHLKRLQRKLKNSSALHRMLKKIVVKLWSGIHRISVAFRQFALLTFLFGLAIDVVVLNSTSFTPFTVLLLSLWLVVAIGYRFRERAHFTTALLFFLMIPLLLILRKESFAEKISNWMYIFFCAGAVELLFNKVFNYHQRDSVRATLGLLFEDVIQPFRAIFRWVLHPAIQFSVKHWQIIEKILSPVFSCALIFSIVSTFIFQSSFYERYYKDEPSKEYLIRTGSYQLLMVLIVLVVLFLFRKKLFKFLRSEVLLLGILLIQVLVFRFTTHPLRTEATITGLNRYSGVMWSEVTIYGNNFGNAPYNNAAVYVEGVPQRVLSWKNDQIIFVVDAYNTKTGELWIQNGDKKKSNTMRFEYIPL